MTTRFTLAAFAALATAAAVPALATAAPTPAPAQRQAAPAQVAPNRTALMRSIDANFKAIDGNGDGTLNQAEVAAAESRAMQQRVAAVRGKIEGEFTKLDTNKDGQLSKAEFQAMVPGLKPRETPQQIVAGMDTNKDGKISLQEYQTGPLAGFSKV
ncbi:MAG TPA: EF-hand domain-containing protein, partial [Thermomicrobiales bacterium]|nr:EF-hand domain-containing protein [Thermomicrobiales bacterium]